MNSHDVIQDLIAQHPEFFTRYENLAQMYYKMITENDDSPIPRAHVMALLELLTESGYKLTKVSKVDSVIQLTPNVLGFKRR